MKLSNLWHRIIILPDHTHAALGKLPLLATASYVLFGLLFYTWSARKEGESFSLKRALKSLFPADLYLHPSSKLDLLVFPLTVGLPIALTAVGFTSLLWTGETVRSWLQATMGASALAISSGWVATTLQFAVVFLAMDFANFMYHYLFHKVPFLWRIHRVHHSAEVLTPLTRWRFHPVEVVLELSFKGPFAGIITGAVLYLFGTKVSTSATVIVAAMSVAFEGTFFFRHSHIWVSYGRLASRLLCSPCMHQIHHSIDPKHWDKNFGLMLSIWDYLFGSRHIPEGREQLQFGINSEEIGERNPHSSFAGALLEPVATAIPRRNASLLRNPAADPFGP
jgi:sterol desaturase/sphingolipid hydroxylase (fatty acid hydroxylase superfamily)